MDRPNILLITVDHWPAELLGCAGHPFILTPNLDQLADCGTRFTNAYSCTPSCIPARRSLMTGTDARTHGDRVFDEHLEMLPELPTLAATFAEHGYQCYAVGKLHVYPQRDRIGFHEVILNEEQRTHLGMSADDYQLYLADQGYPGQWLANGASVNSVVGRPWHLPEEHHPTNWTVKEMCRTIRRRDPRKPGFWYLSFNHPHPPLTPPQTYFDMYPESLVPEPRLGDWSDDETAHPMTLRLRPYRAPDPRTTTFMRRGFYGLCTHIDHQLALVIGTLREEGLLDNTAILFTSDHGEMLGNHRHIFKTLMYQDAANIPLILVPPKDDTRVPDHATDDRLVSLADVMPTLLDLAGIPIPDTVEGRSLLGDFRRDWLYGEHWQDDVRATRMIRDRRYKLIWYPCGNRSQLFDLAEDPWEQHDLAGDAAHAETLARLQETLIGELYGEDSRWVENGRLVGAPLPPYKAPTDRGLKAQRGWKFM